MSKTHYQKAIKTTEEIRNVFRANQFTYLQYLIKSKIPSVTFNLCNTHTIVVFWLCRAALTSDNTMWHLRVILWTAAVAQASLNPSNHVANSRAGGCESSFFSGQMTRNCRSTHNRCVASHMVNRTASCGAHWMLIKNRVSRKG